MRNYQAEKNGKNTILLVRYARLTLSNIPTIPEALAILVVTINFYVILLYRLTHHVRAIHYAISVISVAIIKLPTRQSITLEIPGSLKTGVIIKFRMTLWGAIAKASEVLFPCQFNLPNGTISLFGDN